MLSFTSDKGDLVGPRQVARRLGGASRPRFSICVLVTRWEEYRECMTSFRSHGFDESCCEYLVIDNSQDNTTDGYVGLNEFLQGATGEYVILCHQDVLLLDDDRIALERKLLALDEIDPDWGLCGNAGQTDKDSPVICITEERRGTLIDGAPFPKRVISLDENFITVRRLANLALSHDLSGFHHYGPDLCIIADILGWSSYVIDFMILHKSSGTFDKSYFRSRDAITYKYRRALRSRWMHVISEASFFLSGNPIGGVAMTYLLHGTRFANRACRSAWALFRDRLRT